MNDAADQSKSDTTDWWVVVTKPRDELKAHTHLSHQGFTAYYPLYNQETLRGRQVTIQTKPLFPRYLFMEANALAQQMIHTIRSTYGVSRLLKIGEVPIRVPVQLIEDLRALEAVHMGKTESHFKEGDPVMISHGPYQGLEAIYAMDDGLRRAVVLINLLQKATRLAVDKKQLRKI